MPDDAIERARQIMIEELRKAGCRAPLDSMIQPFLQAGVRAALAFASQQAPEGWRTDIDNAPHGQGCPSIIAVTDADHEAVIGEAWFNEETSDWWWTGTAPGEYYDSPIDEINYGRVTHWRPLPAPPAMLDAAPSVTLGEVG